MTGPLHPHVVVAAAPIYDVVALADGGLAVLTRAGLELRDADLGLRATLSGDAVGHRLLAGADGRWLVCGGSAAALHEGAPGGSWTPVDLGDGRLREVVVTASGFVAITSQGVLVDQAGARLLVALAGRCEHGGAAWHGGAAVSGDDGLAIVDELGDVVATSTGVRLRGRPVALATAIAAVTDDRQVALFDGHARETGGISDAVDGDEVVAFQDGLLAAHDDDDAAGVSCWAVVDGSPELRWQFAAPEPLQPPFVVGDHVVLASYAHTAWVLDAHGAVCATLKLPDTARHVAAFADGVAIAVDDSPDLLWWRSGAPLVRLAHDIAPQLVRTTSAGLVSVEHDALYLWRTDVQGPAPTCIAPDVPLHAPIVIGGELVIVESAGRLVMRARTRLGVFGLRRGATWRPAATRSEALAAVERLLARSFPGPLPEVPSDGTYDESTRHLGQLPVAATVDLQGAAMFNPASLAPELRMRVGHAREAFFAELAGALGTTGRALRAAVRARKLALAPPQPVAGYEYLGAFTSSGQLSVGDPCHIGRKVHPMLGFSLSVRVAGREGVYHVFVRAAAGKYAYRTAELAVVHASGFAVTAAECVARFGVDAGCAGVFDRACPKPDFQTPIEEGVLAGLGAVAYSGHGDGVYPLMVGKLDGKVVKLRLVFLDDAPEIDRLIVASVAGPARPYAASATFALGATVEHVKFGAGSVIRVDPAGKIDVRFADATRTLVHGKK